MDFGTLLILMVTVAILYFIYQLLDNNFNYWSDRGVKGPKPNFLFGNIKNVILMRMSLGEYVKRLHLHYCNETFIGVYMRKKPALIVRDLDLIKDILIKDFSIFSGRGIKINVQAEPLLEHLFLVEPDVWRPLRNKLSPVFTSGKLKEMFYILIECAENMDKFMEKTIENKQTVDVRDLTSKFTTDVIGSCAFGLQMNALTKQENEFRRMGKKIFQMDSIQLIRFWVRTVFPSFYDTFWFVFYAKEQTDFFVNSIKKTIADREKNNVRRNDFVDLLRDIRDNPEKSKDIEMTDTLMAAQAFVFFGAGFETSSSTISNALFELAQNHDVQDTLREEIIDEFRNNNGTLKYESIKNMSYLHKVFQETLRKYPTGHMLLRRSYAPYTFKGTKLSIPSGQDIFMSTYGIHYDPEIYPDPEKFDPDRFDENVAKARHPMAYLPFGDGPRNCIGARFANYETKIGLVYILRKYKVDVCDKTIIPYEADPTTFLLIPKGGIYLKLTRIE